MEGILYAGAAALGGGGRLCAAARRRVDSPHGPAHARAALHAGAASGQGAGRKIRASLVTQQSGGLGRARRPPGACASASGDMRHLNAQGAPAVRGHAALGVACHPGPRRAARADIATPSGLLSHAGPAWSLLQHGQSSPSLEPPGCMRRLPTPAAGGAPCTAPPAARRCPARSPPACAPGRARSVWHWQWLLQNGCNTWAGAPWGPGQGHMSVEAPAAVPPGGPVRLLAQAAGRHLVGHQAQLPCGAALDSHAAQQPASMPAGRLNAPLGRQHNGSEHGACIRVREAAPRGVSLEQHPPPTFVNSRGSPWSGGRCTAVRWACTPPWSLLSEHPWQAAARCCGLTPADMCHQTTRVAAPVGVELHAAVGRVLAQEALVLLGARPAQQAEGQLIRDGEDQVQAAHAAALRDVHPQQVVESACMDSGVRGGRGW